MKIPKPTRSALDAVAIERERQNVKWNGQPGAWPAPLEIKLSVLMEEVGEVGHAINEREPPSALRAELIQVAAVAVRWVEEIDRAAE